MSENKATELRADIEELKHLLQQAKRRKVQELLSIQIRKLETELISVKDLETPKVPVDVPTSSAPKAATKRYQMKLNGYGWDQSDKYIKVFVTLKNVQNIPKEQVYCKLTERSMELHVDNLENKDYLLTINKLLGPISVEDSHWKQKTDMVVIFLAKTNQSIKWSHMTEIEKRLEDQRSSQFQPSTSDTDNTDPQESIMGWVKNMYETGDDDMKRMITKAWYEGQQKK